MTTKPAAHTPISAHSIDVDPAIELQAARAVLREQQQTIAELRAALRKAEAMLSLTDELRDDFSEQCRARDVVRDALKRSEEQS